MGSKIEVDLWQTNLKGNVCRNSTFQVNRKKNATQTCQPPRVKTLKVGSKKLWDWAKKTGDFAKTSPDLII